MIFSSSGCLLAVLCSLATARRWPPCRHPHHWDDAALQCRHAMAWPRRDDHWPRQRGGQQGTTTDEGPPSSPSSPALCPNNYVFVTTIAVQLAQTMHSAFVCVWHYEYSKCAGCGCSHAHALSKVRRHFRFANIEPSVATPESMTRVTLTVRWSISCQRILQCRPIGSRSPAR